MVLLGSAHETRLRRLVGSWSLRAQPGAPGQNAALLRENIEALESALVAAKTAEYFADNVEQAMEILGPMRERVRSDIKSGKAYQTADLRDLADLLDEVVASFDDKM
jgi:hypothetical protein